MNRFQLIFLLLILGWPVLAFTQVSGEVSIIVEELSQRGTLGFDRDKQYEQFVLLKDAATADELVMLTTHNAPSVRGYAFWALAKRDYPDLKSVFIEHLEDRELIQQKNGCMVGKESVISFMKQVVTPYMYDQDCKKLDDATRALVR